MGINGVGSYQTQNYATQNRSRSIERNWSGSKDEAIGNATSLSESSNNGKKIGITTVGDKGYIAMYADSSTEQDPVVKVGDYEVRIKDVNPNNATKMEMFALMSYMDDKGLTNNQGMKSFNKMTAYSTQAEYNGYCSGISDENAAWTEERDWIAILENAKASYYKNPQTYGQGLECEKIIDNLKNWVKGSNPHIPDTVISRDTEYTVPDTNEKVAVNIKYVTSYSEDGISCTKEETVGDKEQSSIIWTIQFEDKEAFDKVKSFLEKVGTDKNLTFATQENFWKDFLVGNISDTEFMAYFESTNNGIIDFENGIQTGMSLRELVSNTYAGYLNNNNFVGHVYSEDDLQPSWYRGGIVNIQQEAEPFYTQKGVRDETVAGTRNLSANGYMELIHKQIEEMQEKIDNDEVNESFQIGGQTFTVEEWDEFLKKFDSIQEAMEALMKERHEKKEEQQTNTEEVVDATTTEMIVSESTSCTYPTDSSNGEDVLHITWYTEEGIYCRKAGQTEGYEWCIPFENKEQYDKVMEYIGQFPKDSDWRFASQEGFWKEFLYGEISADSTTATSNTRRTEIKVSNFKEYETANYKFVPEPDIGSGGMRILKNGQSVAVFSVDNLKIRVDEKTGTRVLISEIPGIGNSWYDALPVDVELENGLAEAIGVDDIPEVALDGYYIGTHAGTGIQYVMRPGDEGRGGKVLLKDAADVAKYNALAEEYFNRYPNLVTSPEYGRIYASFEICGMMERTPTGFVRIGFDNISYNDNLDYKKNWSAKITGETWDLLWKWLEENRSHMEDVGEFSTWGDIIDELGGSYERVWSDEELLQGYLNN